MSDDDADDAMDVETLRAELAAARRERDAALAKAAATPTAAEDLQTLVLTIGVAKTSPREGALPVARAALDRLTKDHRIRQGAVVVLERFFDGDEDVTATMADAALALLRR